MMEDVSSEKIDDTLISVGPAVPRFKKSIFGNPNVTARLEDMPYDIIKQVFDTGNLCAATCLGLTCPQFYAFLKIYHQEPIPLGAQVCDCSGGKPHSNGNSWCHGFGEILACLVADWSGMRGYRLLRERAFKNGALFVNKRIYGDWSAAARFFDKETKVRDRYFDFWYAMASNVWKEKLDHLSLFEIPFAYASDLELSNPFNKGDDWYEEAAVVIKASIVHFENATQWQRFWQRFSAWRFQQDELVAFGRGWDSSGQKKALEKRKRDAENQISFGLTPDSTI